MTEPALADTVAARLSVVRDRIAAAGGDPDRVRIVAVTKGFGVDAVRGGLAAGLLDIGENRAHELVAKADGHAPTRRSRSTSSASSSGTRCGRSRRMSACTRASTGCPLGAEIARRAPGAAVLVQVNLTDDPARGGCPPDEAADLVGALGSDAGSTSGG